MEANNPPVEMTNRPSHAEAPGQENPYSYYYNTGEFMSFPQQWVNAVTLIRERSFYVAESTGNKGVEKLSF